MSPPSEPSPTGSEDAAARIVVHDATCLACGCLCDDLVLSAEGGRVVEARNACEVGRLWFLADHSQAGLPVATVEGRPVEADEAIGRAAEILGRARSPVVLGLSRTSNEAVAAALAVADRIGAAVDIGPDEASAARTLAVQRVGMVSATLGEVKNRADVVVFWGADPIASHPRHWERYSVEPRGRFVPGGRADRTVIVVDADRTATADRADLFVRVAPGARFETLWTLRALVRGGTPDPGRVARGTGLDLATLRDLAARLQAARYGAWFLGDGPDRPAMFEAALTLVRDLNATTRFVLLGLGGPGNAAGARAVASWQAGHPSGVSLARGVPRALPGVTSAAAMLDRGEVDAALIVADDGDTASGLSEAARDHLATTPTVRIAPGATRSDRPATVALASATPGIDAAGTVTRVDGVTLPLRPPLAASVPTDRDWLRAIDDRLHDLEGRA
jgi:formylmethanofuran dehydrogenase subunit B